MEQKFIEFRRSKTSIQSLVILNTLYTFFVVLILTTALLTRFSYVKYVACLVMVNLLFFGWLLCYFKIKATQPTTSHSKVLMELLSYIPILEDINVYSITLTGSLMILYRATYGSCGEINLMILSSILNPKITCQDQALRSDTTAIALIIPIWASVIIRGASWASIRNSYIIIVGSILYSIYITNSADSLFFVLLFAPFTAMIIYEMRRESEELYLMTEELKFALSENQRHADEVYVNEMKMMIGNIAHDLKTVSEEFSLFYYYFVFMFMLCNVCTAALCLDEWDGPHWIRSI